MTAINNVALYDWIYWTLKKNNNGSNFISFDKLKEIIDETIKRFPRKIDWEVVKDMSDLQLVKRINLRTYQILESNCCKRINNLLYNYFST